VALMPIMVSSSRGIVRTLLMALLLAWASAMPATAQESDLSRHADGMKRMQVRFMMRGAQRRVNRELARRRAKASPAPWRPAGAPAAGLARRPAPAPEPPDAPGLASRAGTPVAAPAGLTAIATNQIVNNRATDIATCPSAPCLGQPWSGQCEVSIGAVGNHLVAAWNDGEGFETGLSTQGFGYSNDDGATWVDDGIPPVTGVGVWTSDPVIAVNEKTGAFYYAALCEPTVGTNGVGVVKGTFVGGVLQWGTPQVVVSGNSASAVFDKEWLAADSLTGNLYVIYSRFIVSGGVITSDRIEFSRNTGDNAVAWSPTVTLSSATDAGRVQGARVAVGPAGEVWATWNTIGTSALDFMRVRRATNGGLLWGNEATAASLYSNFGSGAPGFNRGMGFAFPSIAVDRSSGPRRGRVYLAWNESVDFYNDPLGGTPVVNESEPNDLPATADAFTMGKTLVGTISTTSDRDYWSFNGTQGQTIICELDSVYTATLDASFRLICSDQATRLGFSETGIGGFDNASGLIVFTLPADGTYYLTVASPPPDQVTPPGTGGYRIQTGLNGPVSERGHDHRDVFTTHSDNGTNWAPPVRVNGEAAWYDDWLPEVAVAGDGSVFVEWYDWRDVAPSFCAGASMTYLSRSPDNAVSWPDGSPVSTALSYWTTAYSNIAPNQGDYCSLFANQGAVYACWSDGRNNDPDIFMAKVGLTGQASLVSVYADTALVRVAWRTAAGSNPVVTVYRRTDVDSWTPLGQIVPDGTGLMVYEDHAVTAGTRYYYRLGLNDGTGETFTAEVAVDVPLTVALPLAIEGVRPNPTDREIWVSFSLPNDAPATLELLDVTGRRVRERTLPGGLGLQLLDLGEGGRLPTGVYLVRLTQGGTSAVKRISVVR
jgi:hypothetical protein